MISRRQLYAMGEPLGESATYRKADGGLILGGGGSSSPAPTSQTTTTQDLPDWAKGPAQDVLSKGAALTDTSQNPYQAYGGQRIAGFSDLQNQAFNQAGPGGFSSTVGQYMNPYQQNVTDIQKREATRQFGIQQAGQNAQAAQSGAFGGSRQGVLQAEGQRNLNQQLNDIQAQGSNAAFQNAQNQYNTGLNQELQMGGMQQANQQQGLNMAYQDFLNQKNYPYQQLSYMSNLIRGTPMGMNTTSQVYQAPPTTAQAIGSIGLGAYGLSKMAAGGAVKGFKDGGGLDIMQKFNDPQEMVGGMSKLSKEQLQQIVQNPATPAEKQAALEELAILASEDSGLASAYNQIPYSQQQNMVQAAGGGVMGFSGGGNSLDAYMGNLSGLGSQDISVTPEQKMQGISALVPQVQAQFGPSKTEPFAQDIASEVADLKSGKDVESAKGLGALKAAMALSQGNSLIRGLGAAGAAYGDEVAKAQKESRDAQRQLRQSQITLAAADQARADGMVGKAQELFNQGQAEKKEALGRNIDVQGKLATLAEQDQANRRSTAAQMAAVNKPTFELSMVKAKVDAAIQADPTIANDPVRLKALQAKAYSEVAQETKGAWAAGQRVDQTAANNAAVQREKALAAVDTAKYSDPEWKAAKKNNDAKAMAAREEAMVQQRVNPNLAPATTTGGAGVNMARPPNMTDQQWNAYQAYVRSQSGGQ